MHSHHSLITIKNYWCFVWGELYNDMRWPKPALVPFSKLACQQLQAKT